MTDLVEKLRSLAKQVRPFDASQSLTYSDCADELEKAADEIERLEAGLKELISYAGAKRGVCSSGRVFDIATQALKRR